MYRRFVEDFNDIRFLPRHRDEFPDWFFECVMPELLAMNVVHIPNYDYG